MTLSPSPLAPSTYPKGQPVGGSGENPPGPIRVRLRRVKGWRMPPDTRVVTRSTIFGNPWMVGCAAAFWWPHDPKGPRWVSTHPIPEGRLDAREAVAQFRSWLNGDPVPFGLWPENLTALGQRACREDLAARRGTILGALPALRGRNLACTCALGAPCHADVLLCLANGWAE